MSQLLPGQNHNYTTDVKFWTLQTENGRFISNPYAILQDKWKQTGQRTANSFETYIGNPSVNVATTDTWACAWVVYSLSDLQVLRNVLKKHHAQNVKVPFVPCTGIMESSSAGITCDNITRMKNKDVKAFESNNDGEDWSQAPARMRISHRKLSSIKGQPKNKTAERHVALKKLSQNLL